MQKFINNPSRVVEEMLEAYVIAHADLVSNTENERVIKYKNAPIEGKVGIVTGGGSGHKPAFIGYVGRNMVDAVACGELFSSPPAQMFYDAAKAADGGKGIAILYGNYAGDNMNVSMAMEELECSQRFRSPPSWGCRRNPDVESWRSQSSYGCFAR